MIYQLNCRRRIFGFTAIAFLYFTQIASLGAFEQKRFFSNIPADLQLPMRLDNQNREFLYFIPITVGYSLLKHKAYIVRESCKEKYCAIHVVFDDRLIQTVYGENYIFILNIDARKSVVKIALGVQCNSLTIEFSKFTVFSTLEPGSC